MTNPFKPGDRVRIQGDYRKFALSATVTRTNGDLIFLIWTDDEGSDIGGEVGSYRASVFTL